MSSSHCLPGGLGGLSHPTLRSVILGFLICLQAESAFSRIVEQSARQIPVVREVDVVVIGGSTGGVSQAVKSLASATNPQNAARPLAVIL